MFQGSMPGPLLQDADLVIVFESDVPWLPGKVTPPATARIVQIGEDPLHARLPMRGFPSDLTLTATCLSVLTALETALSTRPTPHVAKRADNLRERSQNLHETWNQEAERAGQADTITLPWLNHCLREVIDADTKVISEYSFRQEYCPLHTPAACSPSVPPAASAGASPPRSVSSWHRRTAWCFQFWATEPTCSPTRWPATTPLRCKSCRC